MPPAQSVGEGATATIDIAVQGVTNLGAFELSVIWIDSAMQVVDKVLAKPWRPAYFSRRPAKYALEIHPERWGEFEIGDRVEFHDA